LLTEIKAMTPTDSLNAGEKRKAALPCAPAELRRLKLSGAIVLALTAVVFSMIIKYGNEPRDFVDRMNVYLAAIVAVALSICAYALLRFRRACAAWRAENPPRS
jgi:hypothetical protein